MQEAKIYPAKAPGMKRIGKITHIVPSIQNIQKNCFHELSRFHQRGGKEVELQTDSAWKLKNGGKRRRAAVSSKDEKEKSATNRPFLHHKLRGIWTTKKLGEQKREASGHAPEPVSARGRCGNTFTRGS